MSSACALGQQIIRADSVLVFRTDEDELTNGKGIVQVRGLLRHTTLQPDGSLDLYVFKQQTGYLETVGIKELPKQLNAVPGLLQLAYAPDNGLTVTSFSI